MRQLNLLAKRIIDLIGSIFGIILLAPLFLIISILIKLDSKGSILFKQKRIGKYGEPFYILKFRTMVENAEKIGDGLTVKNENDSRITKVGYFLRKTSLDELPQLFNVFIGNMSLVGPRPPVTYFPYDGYENYPKWAKERFSMKPGVTGLAQTTVRNSVSWDERMKIDLQYIEEFNVFYDIKLVFSTILRITKPSNIYN